MRSFRSLAAVIMLLGANSTGRAGLYYSGETMAELPSQWRGFLVDQRALRNLAVKPAAGSPVSPMRTEYEEAATKLEALSRKRQLSADELADLGALHVRLGQVGKAIELLRAAQREHPTHFRIAANLGTAWQLQGDLDQAALSLGQAVKLAPGRYQKAEEAQLKLVRLRKADAKGAQDLDDLFGVRYLNDKGTYEAGRLAAEERKKLTGSSVALMQQLALWLPADGRLLWQLAELANAHGDVKTAAAIMEGCVSEFGMTHADLRKHRQLTKAVADAIDANPEFKPPHEGHMGALKTRSRRPLLNRINFADLPPVSDTAVNVLPWAVVTETSVDREFKPTFPKYLQELEGKQVSLTGFMRPLDENAQVGVFLLIEYPVGCWFCEVPDTTSLIVVELPGDETIDLRRGLIKVTGKLKLNATDPEKFLYTIEKAKVAEAE